MFFSSLIQAGKPKNIVLSFRAMPLSKLAGSTSRFRCLQAKTAKRKETLLKAIVEQEIAATLEDRKVAEGQLKLEQRLVKKGYATRMPSESQIRRVARSLSSAFIAIAKRLWSGNPKCRSAISVCGNFASRRFNST